LPFVAARESAVVSCDPIYAFSASDIEQRVRDTIEVILSETLRNQADFVWTYFRSIEELAKVRLHAMRRFIEDFPRGKSVGRYREAALPLLPFADQEFDLALSSHFLFHSNATQRCFRVEASRTITTAEYPPRQLCIGEREHPLVFVEAATPRYNAIQLEWHVLHSQFTSSSCCRGSAKEVSSMRR